MSKFFSIFGTIREITPLEQVGNYNKRNVILETTPDENGYTDIYPMEAFGDKSVQKAEQLREGQQITIRFTIRSREYQGKYYTNLSFAGVDERAETERAQRSMAPARVRGGQSVTIGDAIHGFRESLEAQKDDLPFD